MGWGAGAVSGRGWGGARWLRPQEIDQVPLSFLPASHARILMLLVPVLIRGALILRFMRILIPGDSHSKQIQSHVICFTLLGR